MKLLRINISEEKIVHEEHLKDEYHLVVDKISSIDIKDNIVNINSWGYGLNRPIIFTSINEAKAFYDKTINFLKEG